MVISSGWIESDIIASNRLLFILFLRFFKYLYNFRLLI
ncbi:hypothetical protein D1BOALGB6SA_8360 [Olavius sp. associated proteobacterium Delta 1]|nr:hypothetical protein D1BOALGB6SA_8360 [Olavius sp. associated proteobacterium Delta 1]